MSMFNKFIASELKIGLKKNHNGGASANGRSKSKPSARPSVTPAQKTGMRLSGRPGVLQAGGAPQGATGGGGGKK